MQPIPSPSHVPFRDPLRLLNGVLAGPERAVLLWIAARLPARVTSDHLTATALVAMAGAGACYGLGRWSLVGLALSPVCLAINWFGDSLDGTVARVRNRQRPRYGFYVDHVLDAFGALFLLAGLGASGYMSPAVAAAILISYFLLNIEILLATHCLGTFRMSFFGLGATELRLLLGAGSLAAMVHPTAHVLGRTYLLFDVCGAAGAAGLVLTAVISAIRNTRVLHRLERLAP